MTTPFGEAIRRIRRERGVSQKDMARALNVSAAYLSALENGKRGQPGFDFLQRVAGYLNIIWDEAEELQRLAELSHPKITIDTSGLEPAATELANRLARDIGALGAEDLEALKAELIRRVGSGPKRRT